MAAVLETASLGRGHHHPRTHLLLPLLTDIGDQTGYKNKPKHPQPNASPNTKQKKSLFRSAEQKATNVHRKKTNLQLSLNHVIYGRYISFAHAILAQTGA